jgi:nucleoside-diphosphate-sugar epimerase
MVETEHRPKGQDGAMTSALIVGGGTGVVSSAIVEQLRARGVQVSVFNRGLRWSRLGEYVRLIRGDRTNAAEFVRALEHARFDVGYDRRNVFGV